MRKPKWSFKFYKNFTFLWIPIFRKNKLMWKDKFGTPRCELEPQIKFEWFWFGFYCYKESDQYWEQWLWIYNYNNGDVEKAKSTWTWKDFETKISTWKEF